MPTPPRPWAVATAAMVSRTADMLDSKRWIARRPTMGASWVTACESLAAPTDQAAAALVAASILRVMYHCWAIDKTLLTTQYSTRPAGNQRKKKAKMIGISFSTLACIGSGGVGLS